LARISLSMSQSSTLLSEQTKASHMVGFGSGLGLVQGWVCVHNNVQVWAWIQNNVLY
jgi:hypothetical protein